jgi:GNAT superfamily N-acetyltransferase
VIRPLLESDDPSSFSCGVRQLDTFLHRYALDNAAAGIGVTYIVEDCALGISGYVTLSAASIRGNEIEAGWGLVGALPRYPLPALLIARLAVDERCQLRGLGRSLLVFALDEALVARDRIGCIGVLVDAKSAAETFYHRFGFVEVRQADDEGALTRMFVGTATIADSLRQP